MSVAAVTVAERGPPSIKATSPKCSPGPSVASLTPLLETFASPEAMMKKAAPPEPSIMTVSSNGPPQAPGSGLNPFGIRGGSSAVGALQRGHGAPAPPQVHAFGPCQGRTG